MGSKSKKGSQFERTICKMLSLWWSGDKKRDDIFWRTAGSGGRATVRQKQGKKTADSAADMMAAHEDGKPFTKICLTEIKRGYSDRHKIVKNKKSGKLGIRKTKGGLDFLTIVDKLDATKESEVIAWWRKAESERIATGRNYSFIIFQRDKKKECIVMDNITYQFLCKRNGLYKFRKMTVDFAEDERLSSLVTLKLEDFLGWCEPKCFLNPPTRIRRRQSRRIRIKRRKR